MKKTFFLLLQVFLFWVSSALAGCRTFSTFTIQMQAGFIWLKILFWIEWGNYTWVRWELSYLFMSPRKINGIKFFLYLTTQIKRVIRGPNQFEPSAQTG